MYKAYGNRQNNMLQGLELRCEVLSNMKNVDENKELCMQGLFNTMKKYEEEIPGTRAKFESFFTSKNLTLSSEIKSKVLNLLRKSTNPEIKAFGKELRLQYKESINKENGNLYKKNFPITTNKFPLSLKKF